MYSSRSLQIGPLLNRIGKSVLTETNGAGAPFPHCCAANGVGRGPPRHPRAPVSGARLSLSPALPRHRQAAHCAPRSRVPSGHTHTCIHISTLIILISIIHTIPSVYTLGTEEYPAFLGPDFFSSDDTGIGVRAVS